MNEFIPQTALFTFTLVATAVISVECRPGEKSSEISPKADSSFVQMTGTADIHVGKNVQVSSAHGRQAHFELRLSADHLKELAGVLDEIFRVLSVEVGRGIVVSPPAHRLSRRERVYDLIGHLPRPDEVVPKSANDAGVSVRAFAFGE